MSGGAPVPVPTKETILSLADLKEAGDKNLPTLVREFYNSGSTDERTITANSASFAKFHLRSRVLVNVRGLDTSATVLGRKVHFPLCCSPAGIQGMAHPDGELATARAASKWGINMGISSFSSFGLEEIVRAGAEVVQMGDGARGSAYAIQMYPMQDRALQERILKKAERAGCVAVLVTGDSPVLGVRYNEWRNDFRTPEGIGFPNMEITSEDIRKATHDNTFNNFNDDSAAWSTEIAWLRKHTSMRIFIKGIVTGEDIKAAIQWGCDGVIVSNHGGRQLDGVPATIDVLEECVDAAKGSKLEIHMDGGVRRGSDVFVALALGAKAVWVGRPVLWGLAYKGQQGVERMMEILFEDFRRCMALCGCRTVADINKSCLSRLGADGVLRPLKAESRL